MKNPLSIPINYDKRVYGLDVFRAIAIIFVMIEHGGMFMNKFSENFPWIKFIDGVELFFVLSGFLIGSMLIKIIERKGEFRVKDLLNFWKRRWFRTLPNYYLVLALNVIFVKYEILNGDIEQFNMKFLVFMQNFYTPFYDFFWESWSLSIEEWFYIFFPLLSLIILFLMPTKRALIVVIILLLILPLLYRILISNEQVDSFWWDVKFRKLVLTRLDAIMYGVLAAYIKFYHKELFYKYRYIIFGAGLTIIYCMIYNHRNPNDFFSKTFTFSISSIGIMLLLPLADSFKKHRTNFGKAITYISLISYSMYLIHFGLVASFIDKYFPAEPGIDGLFKYLIYWCVTIILSILLYKYFEKPIMDLRDRKLVKKDLE